MGYSLSTLKRRISKEKYLDDALTHSKGVTAVTEGTSSHTLATHLLYIHNMLSFSQVCFIGDLKD